MEKKFKARYGIDDGSVGHDKPHSFYIDESDIEDDMTEAELANLFESEMQAHFENSIFPYEKNRVNFIYWAQGVIENRKRENG